ncbi:MAG: flagellar basal-body rod protein FlgF [Bdellovibrionales bacterium GWA2_49_15]|nr:MAG: flagellar basal-body rod protein FlgF [Bdellovibrionales bacterium GWA2_49_15]
MKELWVPLSGAISQQKLLDTVSNNIANINTAGFKKDDVVFKEYLTALDKGHDEIDLPNKEWAPEDFNKSYGAENSFVKVDGTYTNFAQGELRPTGNSLDLAIKGKGMFEVLAPNGARFTRDGAFSINRDGILVNKDGFPILSKFESQNNQAASNPVDRLIHIDSGKVVINDSGDIFVNDTKTSSLSLVEFEDQNALVKEGQGIFINKFADNIKKSETNSSVHQGFIENSNVNALEEMTNMIKAHRNFESIQKVIKAYDNMAARSYSELTKF